MKSTVSRVRCERRHKHRAAKQRYSRCLTMWKRHSTCSRTVRTGASSLTPTHALLPSMAAVNSAFDSFPSWFVSAVLSNTPMAVVSFPTCQCGLKLADVDGSGAIRVDLREDLIEPLRVKRSSAGKLLARKLPLIRPVCADGSWLPCQPRRRPSCQPRQISTSSQRSDVPGDGAAV